MNPTLKAIQDKYLGKPWEAKVTLTVAEIATVFNALSEQEEENGTLQHDLEREKGLNLYNETLRDRFAMAALTGIVCTMVKLNNLESIREEFKATPTVAYILADAMLEARKKPL